MSHAAYVYDIEHVIVDNLQFMTSYLRFVAMILSLVKITVTNSSLFFLSFSNSLANVNTLFMRLMGEKCLKSM